MGLLRVLKEIIFRDPDGAAADRSRRTPDDEDRRTPADARGGMIKEQFLTELEKLTEAE